MLSRNTYKRIYYYYELEKKYNVFYNAVAVYCVQVIYYNIIRLTKLHGYAYVYNIIYVPEFLFRSETF
jgi:hypothetical protein